MLLPTLSSGSAMLVRSADAPTKGISPSFCTPCIAGGRICGLPFSPHAETCGEGVCTPCVLGKKVCVGFGGVQLKDC